MTLQELTSVFTPEQIAQFVQHAADQINADYAGKEPLFVIVLNGAFVFAADLLRRLNMRLDLTIIRVSSYSGMNSTGVLEFRVPLQQSVEGRDVIIIEDIVDTGLTIHHLRKYLSEKGAASVRVATMLFKPESLQHPDAQPEYVAKSISNEFVIGYGLDLDGFVRNLDAIYKIKE